MLDINEIMKMKAPELRKLIAKEAKAARKRADRMFKKEDIYTSPALAAAKKSKPRGQGALFETRGKNLNELRAEYKRIKNFMEDKTSTIKGAKQFYKDAADKIGAATGGGFTGADMEKVFAVFAKLEDKNAWIANAKYRYDTFVAINNELNVDDDRTADQIAADIESKLDDLYMQTMESDNNAFVDLTDEDWEELGNLV